ncbi:MAG TPA: ribonuclease III [Dehalococcoidia bacterium]|nr:ribonuclease III [Dehalococcoidia bacterium]
MNIALIEESLGTNFQNTALLVEALCHSSFTNEASDPSRPNNERLEFLGDAVLGVAVADELFRTDDALNEGTLTVLRSQIVSGHSLSGAARRLKIGEFLAFGKGERNNGGTNKDSNLAGAFEALVGAVFVDKGFRAACDVVKRWLSEEIKIAKSSGVKKDPKTEYQLITQSSFGETPVYTITENAGPDHAPTFWSEVSVGGVIKGRGSGPSKAAAERFAAIYALKELKKKGG